MPDLFVLHKLSLERPGEPLFAALAEAIPGLSRHQARQAVMGGLVSVDGSPMLEAKHPLGDQAKVVVDLRHGIKSAVNHRLKEGTSTAGQSKPFTILFRDRQVVVVDKAAGILSAPTHHGADGRSKERGHLPELVRRTIRKLDDEEPRFLGLLHRLDQDTSGCLIMALTREAQRLLAPQFHAHSATRTYRALVIGQPRNDADTLHQRLGRDDSGRRSVVDEDEPGKDSVTHFRVLQRFAQGCELEVTLETGRTHQIRVSLANIGCPIYGDRVYAPRRKPKPGELPPPKAPRLMLHAEKLAFDHPVTNKRIEVVAPVPKDFGEWVKVIRK